jgi:excisionase family DNA binding protein
MFADAADPLTEDELAARLKISPRTVKRWRWRRYGPAWFYAGRHVRYRMSAVLEWEAAEQMKAAS